MVLDNIDKLYARAADHNVCPRLPGRVSRCRHCEEWECERANAQKHNVHMLEMAQISHQVRRALSTRGGRRP